MAGTGLGSGVLSQAISGAINTAYDSIGTWIKGKINRHNQKDYYNYTLDKSAQKQLQLAQQTTSAELQGLKDAGLNPAMLNGSFSNPVSAQGQTGAAISGGAGIESLSSLISSQAQAKVSEHQAGLIDAERDKTIQEKENLKNQNIAQQYQNSAVAKYMEQNLGFTPEVANILSQISYNTSKTEAQNIENKYAPEKYEKEIDLLVKQGILTDEEAKRCTQQIQLDKEQCSAQIKYMAAIAWKAAQDGKVSQQQAKKIIEETKQISIQNKYLDEQLTKQLKLTDTQIDQIHQLMEESAAKVDQLRAQGKWIDAQAEQQRLQNDLTKRFGATKEILGMVGQGVNMITDVFATYSTCGLNKAMSGYYNAKSQPLAPSPQAPQQTFNPFGYPN